HSNAFNLKLNKYFTTRFYDQIVQTTLLHSTFLSYTWYHPTDQ
ncbi:unnamed protein product, partial [Heterotrigona itama]